MAPTTTRLSPQVELLKKWRLQKKWTQCDLAHHSGLSLALIKAIERGAHFISYKSAKKLAAALGRGKHYLVEE
jgi:transcriptional regulator with XRE-family HTH domain